MDLFRCGSNKMDDKAPLATAAAPLPNPANISGGGAGGGGGGGEGIPSALNGIPEVNVSLLGMESNLIIITRGRNGFGFTVFGSSPVQIGRIEEGSPAFESGLEKYDCVVRINGQNVSRSTAESVAKIVRDAEYEIRLEVQRLRRTESTDGMLRSVSSEIHPNHAPEVTNTGCAPISLFAGHLLTRQQCLPFFNNSSQEFPRMGLKSRRSLAEYDRIRASSVDYDQMSVTSSEFSDSCSERSWTASERTLVDGRESPTTGVSSSHRNRIIHPSTAVVTGSGRDDPNEINSDSGYGDRRRQKYQFAEKNSKRGLTEEDMLRWSAVRKLVSCEEEFVFQMQLGVRLYLRPLKQKQPSVLSSDEHLTLFQNLETILSMSESQLCQLHTHRNLNPSRLTEEERDTTDNEKGNDVPVSVLASVYLAQIEAFCLAHEKYCDGIRTALHLLVALKKTTDLEQFLNKVMIDCGRLTLSAFLQKPIEHMKDLVLSLQKVLCYSTPHSSGYDSLRQLVKALRDCCYRINENNAVRCGSSLSMVSSSGDSSQIRSLSPSSSSSSSSFMTATSIVSSIDTEVFEIQNRLVFPEHIASFHLATPSHHMIYSGNLRLIDVTGCNIPLFLVLMSDLILLTRPDPDGEALHVLEEPIVLHDVVGCNFNCSHNCEFVLFVETPLKTLQRSWEPRSLQIRAPSAELKCTWKNLLEQRIVTCKSNREVNLSNRKLDNIV